MKLITPLLMALFAGMFAVQAAMAAPIRNADVIKLIEAGMPDEVVLQAIASGEPQFDTSADALIALKAKGASPAVLKAVISPAAALQKTAGRSALPALASGYNPEEVTIIVDGVPAIMQYIVAQQRSGMRALGFGGMANYANLKGPAAQHRINSASPSFIVSVPQNAQIDSYLTLASFAVRGDKAREVMTGGGNFGSFSTGIHRSRIVKIVSEKLADQSSAREGFTLYKISPEQPMKAGEYALVLYTGELRTAGFFSQASNSYFDFGIN